MARIMINGVVTQSCNLKLKKRQKKIKKKVKSAHNKNVTINKWSEENMRMAINECSLVENTSVRKAAIRWSVPRSTLQSRLSGKVDGTRHASGRKPLLDTAAESDLVSIIKTMAQRGFPLGMQEVRRLAYQYAHDNNIGGFSDRKKAAGYDWFHAFAKRHPDICVRKPEPLSLARAAGMNKPVIDNWFNSVSAEMLELSVIDVPSHLWNVDETGLQDYFIPTKVIGETGHPCYQSTATERGETVTAIAAFNAVGTYVAPMLILRGKRFKPEWLESLPDDVDVNLRMSDKGWITTELFLDWGKKFVEQLPTTDTLPHILFLDGHSSHVYNLGFLNLMRENNVRVWCFPPHTTHWIQPADRSFFRSLKHHWTTEGLTHTRLTGGSKLTRGEFFQVFARTWKKAATVENAQSGFTATGLFPLNPSKIPDEAFLPSLTTERALVDQSPGVGSLIMPTASTDQSMVGSLILSTALIDQPTVGSLIMSTASTDQSMVGSLILSTALIDQPTVGSLIMSTASTEQSTVGSLIMPTALIDQPTVGSLIMSTASTEQSTVGSLIMPTALIDQPTVGSLIMPTASTDQSMVGSLILSTALIDQPTVGSLIMSTASTDQSTVGSLVEPTTSTDQSTVGSLVVPAASIDQSTIGSLFMPITPTDQPTVHSLITPIAPTDLPARRKSFHDLVTIPTRKRKPPTNRKKLENYNLTSDLHVNVVADKKSVQPKVKNKPTIAEKIKPKGKPEKFGKRRAADKPEKVEEKRTSERSKSVKKTTVEIEKQCSSKKSADKYHMDPPGKVNFYCGGCNVLFEESKGTWIRCLKCLEWWELECAGMVGKRNAEKDNFVCDDCL